jgi:hypothetical protein
MYWEGMIMDQKKICQNQVEEMKRHRWIESQKAGRDVGREAFEDWIKKHAEKYRKEYNETYEEMINRVTKSVEESVKVKFHKFSSEEMKEITKIIVDKFTELWTIDLANNSNKHIEEI